MPQIADIRDQFEDHLGSSNQVWLLGAGISLGANIPLMVPLTARVKRLASQGGGQNAALIDTLCDELPETCHIEHVLSQLGDYVALAERSRDKAVKIGGQDWTAQDLRRTHAQILKDIAETIRYGYIAPQENAPEIEGSRVKSLINIEGHLGFVRALFKTAHAGLNDRRQVRIFTTNYDTLIEDALALEQVPYLDGFRGGAVAYWDQPYGVREERQPVSAILVKLHGSIDWHQGEDGHIWRVRDGDPFPSKSGRVLIYPQATKYQATQRDPFAALFDRFRKALTEPGDQVLCICGYSFGDEHINDEIERAMARPGSRHATVIAFAAQREGKLPEKLEEWRQGAWGGRVYVATQNGIFHGATGPFLPPQKGEGHDWWTFGGVTKLLRDGLPAELVDKAEAT